MRMAVSAAAKGKSGTVAQKYLRRHRYKIGNEMRITPCQSAKATLRTPGVSSTECNCCGNWEFRRMTDNRQELRDYAFNPITRKAVRL